MSIAVDLPDLVHAIEALKEDVLDGDGYAAVRNDTPGTLVFHVIDEPGDELSSVNAVAEFNFEDGRLDDPEIGYFPEFVGEFNILSEGATRLHVDEIEPGAKVKVWLDDPGIWIEDAENDCVPFNEYDEPRKRYDADKRLLRLSPGVSGTIRVVELIPSVAHSSDVDRFDDLGDDQ